MHEDLWDCRGRAGERLLSRTADISVRKIMSAEPDKSSLQHMFGWQQGHKCWGGVVRARLLQSL